MRQKWKYWTNNHHARDSQIREGYQSMVANLKQKFESEAAFQRENHKREKEELLSSLEGENSWNFSLIIVEEKDRLHAKATENLLQLASENMELKDKIQRLYAQLDEMSMQHEQKMIAAQKEMQRMQEEYEKKLLLQVEEHRVNSSCRL